VELRDKAQPGPRASTGIRRSGQPANWLVPPWPTEATITDVTLHFTRFDPMGSSTTNSDLLAYYEGFLAAIESAPKPELRDQLALTWYENLRSSTVRCVEIFRSRV
jgi:hypothetical protein